MPKILNGSISRVVHHNNFNSRTGRTTSNFATKHDSKLSNLSDIAHKRELQVRRKSEIKFHEGQSRKVVEVDVTLPLQLFGSNSSNDKHQTTASRDRCFNSTFCSREEASQLFADFSQRSSADFCGNSNAEVFSRLQLCFDDCSHRNINIDPNFRESLTTSFNLTGWNGCRYDLISGAIFVLLLLSLVKEANVVTA